MNEKPGLEPGFFLLDGLLAVTKTFMFQFPVRSVAPMCRHFPLTCQRSTARMAASA